MITCATSIRTHAAPTAFPPARRRARSLVLCEDRPEAVREEDRVGIDLEARGGGPTFDAALLSGISTLQNNILIELSMNMQNANT